MSKSVRLERERVSRRLTPRLGIELVVLTFGLCSSQAVQGQGLFSSQSGFSSSGTNLSANGLTSSSLFGGSSISGLGQGASTAGGFTNSRLSVQPSGALSGQLNGQFGQGGSRQFVGADRSDFGNSFFQNYSSPTTNNPSSSNRSMSPDRNRRSASEARRFQAEQPQTAAKIPIRSHLTLKFSRPSINSTTVAARLNKNLRTIFSAGSNLPPLTVQVTGRTATLTGQVASEDERRLANRLVQIQPGISVIHDELQVAQN
ncbi:MAG: BON domain-containing protein [Planctomycetota bacterium]|nr:BON domain-containing protein [Planctomycetota bacterium]